jgi:signal transduction histidine kinase
LTNIAITTGNFLSREEFFSHTDISKIDSLTAISFTRKTIQAYDLFDKKIYSFNDDEADTLSFNRINLAKAKIQARIYTQLDNRDVVFYRYTGEKKHLIIVAAGYDLIGHQNLKSLLHILTFSFLIGILIAIISGYIFSRKLLQPLGSIADDINEISAQGLAKRIDAGTSPDEWNYLSRTLNNLLDRLQESFESQGRFISNASHELSAPLASISSQLEISLQRERSNEEYKKIMQSIHTDMRQMGKFTHALLEFAKASGNRTGIEIKAVRIDEVILRISSEISKINNRFSISLNFDKASENPDHLIVFGNEELLTTAIKNIVLNACKYSDNQKANITLHANSKVITLSIWNTGDGIPHNEFENIFLPFYRVEKYRVEDGFGLGLPLAKKIIKLHNGEIIVNSKQGGTTIFTVTFRQTPGNNRPK